jgi:hypothetical protein
MADAVKPVAIDRVFRAPTRFVPFAEAGTMQFERVSTTWRVPSAIA